MRGLRLLRCLASVSWLGALLLQAPSAAAEGSPEFDTGDAVTGGDAHDQEVNSATLLYVDVLNTGGTEKICWRGSGDLTVYLPNGTVHDTLESSNAGGCTGALSTTGAYRVALENSQSSGTRWEVRVCASTVSNTDCRSTSLSNHRNGRLWSTEWSFQSNTSFAADRSNNGSVFAVVPGGDVGRDAVIEMQMRGVSGAFYRLFANSTGPQTTGGTRVGRSVPKTGHAVVPLYRLYLHPPEGALYNWIPPVVSSVVQTSTCSGSIVLDTAPGTVTFNSNITGQYVLICDVNSDGVYDFASPNDFSSFGNAASGSNTVTWNGRTNGNVNAAAGTYNCVVRLNVGEFHYMADDIETSHPGIRMFRVESNRTTKTAIRMFWDDTGVSADGETMNGVAGVFSPSSPVPAGLDPGTYATASSPFYYVGGNTSMPTGNARAWGNFDGDGKGNENYLDTFAAADTMQSPAFQVSVITAAGDTDNDGLGNSMECSIGTDPQNIDTDGDGVDDGDDEEPLIPSECTDSDMDGCDDCALGMADPNNDGPDTDMNGQCDNGDPDGDTVPNIDDVAPNDPLRCRDLDGDSCDDCSAGAGPNVGNDGLDKDADTICDKGDVDSDNDGISDIVELGGTDLSLDADNDGVPDYNDPSYVVCLDLLPLNGICDALPASVDADGDSIPNHLDRDSDRDGLTDAREAGGTDANGDGVPDSCLPVAANGACAGGLIASPPDTDAPGDALRDYLDTDSDGDGLSDYIEAYDSNGDGTADVARTNLDTDADGIDNAFDPSCAPCGGVTGQPVTTPLSAARDSNGDGIGDWLQVCGDAYVTGAQACDDGNSVNTDACSNTCLRGTSVSCLLNNQCSSNLCDLGTFTCQACADTSASGTDTGCTVGAPTCRTTMGVNSCFVCADSAAGTSTDDGCSAATPMCNTSANGGLGACVACLADANCDDGNACTTDTCSSNTCNFAPRTAGTSCTGGVCNGAPAMCVACVDNAPAGSTDSGCGGATPACDTSGAAPVCVACVADGDCASGVCGAGNTCVTCENDQAGAAADHGCGGVAPLCDAAANGGLGVCVGCFDDQAGDATDIGCGGATPVCNPTSSTCASCLDAIGDDDIGCSGATAMCNTSGNGGLGACVACLNAGHCGDGNSCTTDSCTAGACSNPPASAGTACAGGVCNGTAPAMCVACVDNAGVGLTDAGCGGATPACDTSGAAPVCVACVADGDCASGVCGASNTCVTCEDTQAGTTTDHGCGGGSPLCDAAANGGAGACVACFDSQTGDATDLGCGGATPVCNPTSSTCATCLDAAGNDDVGCSGTTALCNTSGNGGLGACVACLSGADCSDGNTCTSDTCTAGACSNPPVSAGTACAGGVCDGTASAMCVACVDTAGAGSTDAGCGGATPACDTSGAAPVCVACVVDGDCASGVCGASNTCVTCEDDQAGAATDHGCGGASALCDAAASGGLGACVGCFDDQAGDATDLGCGGATPVCNPSSSTCATCLDAVGDDDLGCSGATAMCNTSGNGGLGVCAGCLNDGQCNDNNACTTDTCQSGSCDNDSLAAGSTCAGGLCDGAASAPECVECLGLADCPMGMYCSVDRECEVGCAQDSDCVSFPDTPRCESTDQVCVECLTGADCQGTELCDASHACSQPDSDGDGITDDVDLDDDNDGVTDDLELDGEDLSLDSDDDGVPDYRDVDAVTCADAAPADGVCDETAEEVDADGDGIPNHLDRDSDADGITDAREAADNDDDGDGIPDDCLPVDADGLCQSGSQEPSSTDEDGTPDFLDLDSDGDGLLDLDEAFDSDGDGVSNIEPAGADTDDNGIDDAFDPSCDVGACNGVVGQPVLGALAASQDWDGNGVPNWLQTCGDSYPTAGEACDDGNGVDGDACSNSCLRGIGESCDDDGECGSTLCDPELETCEGCIDDEASGADTGCGVDTPTCVVVSGQNACVVCADDQTGLGADDGCSGDAALCDETAAGGLGACIECFSATDCDDNNDCTTDRCVAGACDNSTAAAGSACDGGVCDGEAGGACVACVDDEGAGATDSGCSGDTPACDASGAAPVCIECAADADCSAGVCDGGQCVACDDDAAGSGQDRGCSSDAPFCDTDGGNAVCIECLENADCEGGYCSGAGACVPGCSTDGDCASEEGAPRCDTENSACVQCTSDEHCRGEMLCTAGNTCSFDDHDGDGIADDADEDDDNDGITDRDELGGDLGADEDGDGVLDFHDPDFVSCTAAENAAVCDTLPEALDVDGDDIPNHLDTDSDDDGLPDATEGHDSDFDGVPDRTPANADTDRDGLDDAFDADCATASECDAVIGVVAPRPDADDDEQPNFLDADDDGDGRATADERADAEDYEGPAEEPADIDGDGRRNWYDTDSDGDGALDITENMNGGDANDDDLLDYLDPSFRATDTDGDGVLDVVECPAPAHPDNDDCPDTDGDGKPDYNDTDDDNDGVLTATELNPPQGRDADGDGKPNYLDTDDDGDGVLTKDELDDDGGVLDTDNDGTSNQLDTDDDNDGIPTERELDEDGAPMDTDEDGRPNHLDTDDDEDTIPTSDEIADDGSFLDTDDDGISNHLDPDDDGDGIVTADEPGDDNDNDVPDYLEPYKAPAKGTLAGGALCAVSNTGSGGGSSLASGLLLGIGLLITLRLRSRKKKPRDLALLYTLFALFACLSVSTASAQVAVDQFKPAPLASDGFALSRPDVLKPGAWGLVLMLDYANDPLVFELIPGDEDSEHSVIGDHLVGHVGAAVGIFDRLTIFGMLPIHLVMSGDDDPMVAAPRPDGAGIGDLAFGGRLLMLGSGTSTGALALEFIARVPTAQLANGDQSYSGDTIGSYEPALVGEVRAGRFDIRLRAGARLREPRTVGNLELDHELVYGMGARYRLIEALYAHAEVYGSTFLQNAFAREQTPLEALLGGKYQPGDFNFGVAAGPGILRGYGSPDVRIVASIGYAPVEKHEEPVDTDRDGLFDPADACPLDPEDKDEFEDQDGCPDPDNDKDGIVDVQDQCVMEPEDADHFEDENGCPDPDNDQDGIVDARDKCMNDPEDTDDFEDEDGCPDPDNDKDGLIDAEDSCPNDPEDLDGFEDGDGCPEEGSGKVKVTCEKIDLQDKVFFDTGSDRIQERSFELLDQVVAVLKAAKHIKHMRIEGHTDDRGNDAKNLDLSKRRAASVVRYLTEHGVAEERLESEGYGESRPIMTNKTAQGRGENRRVEFVIVEQDSSCAK